MTFFLASLRLHLARLVRRPSTLVCLLLLPLLALALGLALPQSGPDPVKVGIARPENSPAGETFWQALSAYSDDDLAFYEAESEEQLQEMVAARAWECGYVLAADFEEKVQQQRYTRIMTRVDSPATTLGEVLDWSATAALLEVCAPDIAMSYLDKSGILAKGEQPGRQEVVRDYFNTENLMRVELTPVGGKAPQSTQSQTAASLLRGATALLLLLFSCLCAVNFSNDMLSGFFARLRAFESPAALYFPFFAAASLLSAGAGLCSLLVGRAFFPGYFGPLLQEVGLLLLYLLVLAALSYLLSGIFTGRELLICVLPFFMLACILLSPIVMDLASAIPGGQAVATLLPTTLYLRAAAGAAGAVWGMAAYAAAAFLLGLLVHGVRQKARMRAR